MKENSVIETGKQCLRDEAEAILLMLDNIDENFEKAVDLIYNCKGKCVVTGVGKSGHIGRKIAATLASTGTPAFFLNPLDAYHGDLGMVSCDDVIVAISYSGNTDELLRIIPTLLDCRVPIIGISGDSNSLLAQYSTVHLNIFVEREADALNLAPTTSTTVTLVMGDALACALEQKRNFQPEDFARFHPGGSLGRRLLTKVKSLTRTSDLPVLFKQTIIQDALPIISNGQIGLAVVIEGNKILGVVSDGDIRRELQASGKDSFSKSVSEIMTKTPIKISEMASLSEAENIFKATKRNILVVVNENNDFVGLLNYNDL